MTARKRSAAERRRADPLTAARLREVVHYDPGTGAFTRLSRTCNRVQIGQPCGSPNSKGYLQISVDNRLYLAANLAVLYVTGKWPVSQVDHRNTVKTDNRWDNLRDVSGELNAQNVRSPRRSNKSGFLGVSACGDRWAATISKAGKKIHIGLYATPEAASAAYVAKKRELHPGNTL